MNIFSAVEGKLDKFAVFILGIFGNTAAVIQVLQKISPATLATLMATFYDVMKFVTAEIASGGAALADLKAGNIPAALNDILTTQTKTLFAKIVTDIENDDATIKADLTALGIALKTPAAPVAGQATA